MTISLLNFRIKDIEDLVLITNENETEDVINHDSDDVDDVHDSDVINHDSDDVDDVHDSDVINHDSDVINHDSDDVDDVHDSDVINHDSDVTELQIEENLFGIWINYNGRDRNQKIKEYLENVDIQHTTLKIDTFLGEELQDDGEQLFDHIIHVKYNIVNPITESVAEKVKENLDRFIETELNIRNFVVLV